jgi:hypothetical protein
MPTEDIKKVTIICTQARTNSQGSYKHHHILQTQHISTSQQEAKNTNIQPYCVLSTAAMAHNRGGPGVEHGCTHVHPISVGNGREHAFPELSPRLDRSNAHTHRETEEEDDEQ